MANTRDKQLLVLTNNKHFISLNRGFLGRILDHVCMYLFVLILYVFIFFQINLWNYCQVSWALPEF